MRIFLIFGLLIVLVTISSGEDKDSHNFRYYDDEHTDFPYDDDDDDDDIDLDQYRDGDTSNNTELSNKKLIQPIGASSTTKTPTTEYIFLDLTDKPKKIYECPNECLCGDGTIFLNCTNRNLTVVPQNLPIDVIEINLSNNNIIKIHEDDFCNYTSIRNIILSNNKLTNIAENIFRHLHLSKLDLSSNLLTDIHVNTFQNLPNLRVLSLKENPIIIPIDDIFLNIPDLEELNLENCNITDLYETTFSNLTGLTYLNLANNPIDENNFMPETFLPLQNLEHLKIPTIHEHSFPELCKTLSVIDIITMNKDDVSCFQISSGLSFEDSTVTMKTIIINTIELVTEPILTNETTLILNSDRTTQKTIKELNVPIANNNKTNDIFKYGNDIKNDTLSLSNNSNKKAAMSTEDPVNKILIGIIVVAFVGLIIGIIFRKDYCGIKTKLCRTNRRRQQNANNVQPHEEVPLNKV